MSKTYNVSIASITEVHTLDNIWNAAELRALLECADADDIGEFADDELLDVVLMVLQDLEHQKAGELVLNVVFGDSMRPGVRQNLVDDLEENEPWNDFAEVSQQRGIFVAVWLLQKAFPNRYGTPDALELRLSVHSKTADDLAALRKMQPQWLVRLLSCGMDEHNIVHRLYTDELRAGAFADAAGLIWQCGLVEGGSAEEGSCTLDVIASAQLFASLEAGQEFKAVVAENS